MALPDQMKGVIADWEREQQAVKTVTLHRYVLSYLSSQGYSRTVREFLSNSFLKDSPETLSPEDHSELQRLIIQNKHELAISRIEESQPELKTKRIYYLLKIAVLLKLIQSDDIAAAIAFSRQAVLPFALSKEDARLLEDALSLLAYENHQDCPASYLVRPAFRTMMVSELNQALLQSQGKQIRYDYRLLQRCFQEFKEKFNRLQENSDLRL